MTEDWAAELSRGRPDRAWDLFLTRYRRLIFAAIRHYTTDHDDVMDVFAHACEHLHADDMRRLRTYVDAQDHRARFTTWLVTVVRHLTVDWLRQRDGRRRLPAAAEQLPPLRRRIYELVFLKSRSHVETYELLRTSGASDLSFRDYLRELRATYDAAGRARHAGPLVELSGPESSAAADPEPLDLDDLERLADRVLRALGDTDRLAVQLYVLDGLPAERVAVMVGLPNAKAVYNRVYRALAASREALEQAGIRREDLL